MNNLEKAAEIAAAVLANNPREYNDGRRVWAKMQVMADALVLICGEENEFGTPADSFDEKDPEAELRADLASESGNEWIGESWANRY